MQSVKLDDIDHALLDALRADGRASLGALSKATGLSADAARERLRRLRADGIVQVSASVDPSVLGLRTLAIVGIRARGQVEVLAEQMTEIAEVDFVVCALGSFDVLIEVVCDDDLDLVRILDRSVRSNDQVGDCVVFKSIGLAKWSPGSLGHRGSLQGHGAATTEVGPDDAAVIGALREDGRASFRQLADRTGLGYQSARRRAQALISSGTIRIETVVNRLVDDRAIIAMVGLRTVGSAKEVARQLERVDEVEVALITTGPFDVLLEVVCRDEAHLGTLVGEALREIAGVEQTETFVYSRLLKLPIGWAFQTPEAT